MFRTLTGSRHSAISPLQNSRRHGPKSLPQQPRNKTALPKALACFTKSASGGHVPEWLWSGLQNLRPPCWTV
jgi:hypothetical protein